MRKAGIIGLSVLWLVLAAMVPIPWWYGTLPISFLLGLHFARLWRWAVNG